MLAGFVLVAVDGVRDVKHGGASFDAKELRAHACYVKYIIANFFISANPNMPIFL